MKLILKNSELHFDYLVIPDAIKPAVNAYGNSLSEKGKVGLIKLYNFMSTNGYWDNLIKFYAPFLTNDASKAFLNIKDANVDADLSSTINIDSNGIYDKQPDTIENTRIQIDYSSNSQFNKSIIFLSDKESVYGSVGVGFAFMKDSSTYGFLAYNQWRNDLNVTVGVGGFTRYEPESQRTHEVSFYSFLPSGTSNNLRTANANDYREFTINQGYTWPVTKIQIGGWQDKAISSVAYKVNFGRHLQVGLMFDMAMTQSDWTKIRNYLYALDDYMMGVTDEFVDPVFS